LEQQDLNKRLLLALVLSFIVFIGYGYLFPATKPIEQKIQQSNAATTHQTPVVSDASPMAPQGKTKAVSKNAPVQTNSTNTIAILNSKNFNVMIDAFGRIAQVELLEDKYKDEDAHTQVLFHEGEVKPLEIRFADVKLNEEAFKTPYVNSGSKNVKVTESGNTLTLTQTLSTLTVTKKLTFKPNGAYDIEVTTSKPAQFFVTPGHRPMADTSMYMLVRGALVKGSDDIITSIEDGDAEGYETFKHAKIASAFDRYVASMFYDFDKGLNVSILKEANGDPLIFVEGSTTLKLQAYVGPKEHDVLEAIHPELTDAIEFGWFSFLAKPFYSVLLWLYSHVGNWGWAIILFTLLVKLILFPLSYKGMMSMNKLKDLAPKMKELKEKYKGDSAKMNMKMMEMYKKEGANPMGGCLPMLLQIPVFFALYRVLLNADELQGAIWIGGWIDNLAAADPYYILPVLMGLSMWFQQKITPNNFTDPMQEKIFKWFPVLMAGMFIIMPFPSGLVLYWVVNNIFTIGQQYIINNAYAKQKAIDKK